MPPTLSQGTMLWERLPWDAVLRSSCPKQRLQQHARRTLRTVGRTRKATALRMEMYQWLDGPGQVFKEPREDGTNYMSAYDVRTGALRRSRRNEVVTSEDESHLSRQEREDRAAERRANTSDAGVPPADDADMSPFPLNRNFRSQAVLSEDLRELVYQKVTESNGDLRTVSALYGIDMRRVAAVVRLKTIEKQWIADGKKLARTYNDAVLGMLPQTHVPRSDSAGKHQHESINDLPVHPATRNQIWVSAPESSQFNRKDAAQAFSHHLLPPDKRIAHPQLVTLAKLKNAGATPEEVLQKAQELQEEASRKVEAAAEKKRLDVERTTRVVPGKRWDFTFKDFSVDSAGSNGRSAAGVGVRYGMPHDDRKRGKYKLPTTAD